MACSLVMRNQRLLNDGLIEQDYVEVLLDVTFLHHDSTRWSLWLQQRVGWCTYWLELI